MSILATEMLLNVLPGNVSYGSQLFVNVVHKKPKPGDISTRRNDKYWYRNIEGTLTIMSVDFRCN